MEHSPWGYGAVNKLKQEASLGGLIKLEPSQFAALVRSLGTTDRSLDLFMNTLVNAWGTEATRVSLSELLVVGFRILCHTYLSTRLSELMTEREFIQVVTEALTHDLAMLKKYNPDT